MCAWPSVGAPNIPRLSLLIKFRYERDTQCAPLGTLDVVVIPHAEVELVCTVEVRKVREMGGHGSQMCISGMNTTYP